MRETETLKHSGRRDCKMYGTAVQIMNAVVTMRYRPTDLRLDEFVFLPDASRASRCHDFSSLLRTLIIYIHDPTNEQRSRCASVGLKKFDSASTASPYHRGRTQLVVWVLEIHVEPHCKRVQDRRVWWRNNKQENGEHNDSECCDARQSACDAMSEQTGTWTWICSPTSPNITRKARYKRAMASVAACHSTK